MELNGPEAKEAFMAKVRRRLTFGMDPGAGSHSHATTWAWAWGYEQALADLDATKAVFEKALAPPGGFPVTNPNQPSGHYFVDADGDGLCDYRTTYEAAEKRCLNPRPGHRHVFIHNEDSDGKGMAGGSGR